VHREAAQLAVAGGVDDADVRDGRYDEGIERRDGVLEAERPVGDLRDRRQQREALAVATTCVRPRASITASAVAASTTPRR